MICIIKHYLVTRLDCVRSLCKSRHAQIHIYIYIYNTLLYTVVLFNAVIVVCFIYNNWTYHIKQ